MKSEVLAAIGDTRLRLPGAVNAALAANNRLKYAFSLLQMAASHAIAPDRGISSLKAERIACGIDDRTLDTVVSGARRAAGAYQIPLAGRVIRQIAADLEIMAAPLAQSETAARLPGLLAKLPAADDDTLTQAELDFLTRAGADADTVHQFVMDVHKRLNALQATLAEEMIEGAACYGLQPEDRPLVTAFMAGLKRTAPLKFDHPGLATTATRRDGTLAIQNDIGTTDAHVMVIDVAARSVTVTYTDVHAERLDFFRSLLDRFDISWSVSGGHLAGAGSAFTMAKGVFAGDSRDACAAFLTHLGARLVFLIDWNRARKQLRAFLPGPARVRVLRWAAEQEVGHRGFLELGGARLVNQAIEAAAGSAMHFGDRLSDVLGEAEAETLLRFVLRAASEGLRARQSPSLVHDRIRVELARHFANEEVRLLSLAAEHAGLVFELALAVQSGLAAPKPELAAMAARAARHEREADLLSDQVRRAVLKRPDCAAFAPLLRTADDAADALEEAAFLRTMLAETALAAPLAAALDTLAALLVACAQAWVRVLAHAPHVRDTGTTDDSDDLLTALESILALEHKVDEAERHLTEIAVRDAPDFRALHVCGRLGERLEEAADAIKHASLILRDLVLEDVHG